MSSSSTGGPPAPATARRLGSPRGSPRRRSEDASCRPLQPTHDTSTRGSFDSRARSFHCVRPLDASSTEVEFFRAAPNHLAAIRPRLGTRLTARLQLRIVAHTPLAPPLGGRERGRRRWRRHPDSALSAELGVGKTTSDAPCRAPRLSGSPDAVRNQNRFHRPLVNDDGLSRLRAPFLDKCSQERRFRDGSGLREPATDLAA
jgi:hypothetical protein